MKTPHREIRAFFAAILVVGLLLTGVAAGGRLSAPCSDGLHHGTGAASAATVVQLKRPDATPGAGTAYGLAGCCTTSVINCCTSAAVLPGEIVRLHRVYARSAWISAAASAPHGLGSKVNRHPPRLA